MNNVPPCALTIAGSDSSGGAGIQADLKTFAAFGVYGTSVITAITAQNTLGVQAVYTLPVDTVIAQLDAVLSDLPISVVKIGMLSSAEIVSAVADRLSAHKGLKIVVDTVMVSSSGKPLLSEEAIQCLTNKLLPCATVITPNHPEASQLLGLHRIDDPEQAAYDLLRFNAEAVLLKGGHMESSEIDDILVTHDTIQHFRHAKLQTNHTHGTGCSLSSAIAANLAHEYSLHESVSTAITWLQGAIAHAWPLGSGHGPVHHFWELWSERTSTGSVPHQ